MTVVKFKVREFHQAGGGHVVSYNAVVEVSSSKRGVTVTIGNTIPADPFPEWVEAATASIQAGITAVLKPLRLEASAHINRLVIHPFDFKPRMYEMYTIEYFQKALRSN